MKKIILGMTCLMVSVSSLASSCNDAVAELSTLKEVISKHYLDAHEYLGIASRDYKKISDAEGNYIDAWTSFTYKKGSENFGIWAENQKVRSDRTLGTLDSVISIIEKNCL